MTNINNAITHKITMGVIIALVVAHLVFKQQWAFETITVIYFITFSVLIAIQAMLHFTFRKITGKIVEHNLPGFQAILGNYWKKALITCTNIILIIYFMYFGSPLTGVLGIGVILIYGSYVYRVYRATS